MAKPKISIIVALDDKNGIGKSGGLLWHISEDLKHFKEITSGHPIIMGRKTHESIGRVLPNRTNIIITRDKNFQAEGCIVVHSLDEALEKARTENIETFIIGGGEIYAQALAKAGKIYLTKVRGDFGATVFFPDYSDFNKITKESDWLSSNGLEYKFLELEKSS